MRKNSLNCCKLCPLDLNRLIDEGKDWMLKFKNIMVGFLQVNCFMLCDEKTRKAVVIDPGDEAERIFKLIEQDDCTISHILLTHGHFDHLGGVAELKKLSGASVCIHAADASMLEGDMPNGAQMMGWEYEATKADQLLKEGDELALGTTTIKVLETPGHSPGGLSFLCEQRIFTGDCLFCEGLGRTDLPGGDLEILIASIKRLTELDGKLEVWPGHGPPTTIAHERECNPALHSNLF